MDHAHAPTKLTSLFQMMESDIVQLVELTVKDVPALIIVLPAHLHIS